MQEHKRPTIADLQEHPVILKCMETSKRKSSSSSRSSDSGHDLRYESLRKWEETLKAREQEIERMEKRLKESEELLKKEDSLKKLEKQLTLREKEIDGTLMIIFLFLQTEFNFHNKSYIKAIVFMLIFCWENNPT